MKILLVGASGYIGSHLLPQLLKKGHEVFALVRDPSHFSFCEPTATNLHIIEADLLKPSSLSAVPDDIEAAYYLAHSMRDSRKFQPLEIEAAQNFIRRMENTGIRQIIYLGGLANEANLSSHLESRKTVGKILQKSKIPTTILMAGIIIGEESASFIIIRDLVEKLPIMIAPKWIDNLTQPIAVQDVLSYLILVLDNPKCLNQSFEIGGPDVLSYRELMLRFAKSKNLKRFIFSVPVLTPRLSSYWLFFISETDFSLARSLVESLMNNAVCKETKIRELFPLALLSYEEAIKRILEKKSKNHEL